MQPVFEDHLFYIEARCLLHLPEQPLKCLKPGEVKLFGCGGWKAFGLGFAGFKIEVVGESGSRRRFSARFHQDTNAMSNFTPHKPSLNKKSSCACRSKPSEPRKLAKPISPASTKNPLSRINGRPTPRITSVRLSRNSGL